MKLSIAIATYNEQDTIDRCLTSVEDVADEMVVVDGSSTDRTVSLAKKRRARVIITDNPINFHINKQKAIDASQGNWILQLDADEVVSEKLRNEIHKIIHQQPTTNLPRRQACNQQLINGYWLPRKNYLLGRWLSKGGQYPDYTMRLYRRGKGRLPCKSVHEQAEVIGNTGYLVNPLEHYHYPDFTHYLEHFNRYTTILAVEFKEKDTVVTLANIFNYMILKPILWFLSTYFRHRGYIDGFAGFVFSFYSALRFPCAFVKYWELIKRNNEIKK